MDKNYIAMIFFYQNRLQQNHDDKIVEEEKMFARRKMNVRHG
jgi:hypothetical protein